MEAKEVFYQFLVENGVLFEFTEAIAKVNITFETLVINENTIDTTFTWILSTKGWDYWKGIDDKWKRKYNEYENGTIL